MIRLVQVSRTFVLLSVEVFGRKFFPKFYRELFGRKVLTFLVNRFGRIQKNLFFFHMVKRLSVTIHCVKALRLKALNR